MNFDDKISIVSQIEELVSDIPGWTPIDQLLSLYIFAMSSAVHSDGDILEIGSWCGRSSVVLGMASKFKRGSKVHCVDLFPEKDDWYENSDGSFSFKVTIDGSNYGGYGEQTVWKEPFNNSILPVYKRWHGTLQAFNSSVKKAGFEDIVIPFKGDMNNFATKSETQIKIRMAFIDGDHSFKSVCEDIENVEKLLLSGGWICFDDAFSAYDGVNKAIEEKIILSGRYDFYQQITRKLFVARKI